MAIALERVPEPPSSRDATADLRPWLAFAACGSIWGSTFLVISFGNDVLAPVWAAALRLLLATVLLGAWLRARGERLPRGAALRAALAFGTLQFGVNFPLLYWGEKVVPSGVAAVFYATIPLSSAFITHALGMERLSARKVLGAVLAFAGVAELFSSNLSSSAWHGPSTALGMLAIFIGASASGLGTILLKRGPRQDPIGANAVGCAVGALMAFAASAAIGEPHRWPTTVAAAFPLLYLTLAGSLGAFVILSWLVNHWSVTRASYITVVVPVIALALGALVRREPITPIEIAGSATVLAGLLIGMRSPARRA